MWVKKHQNGLSGNQKFKTLGPFIYIPILSVSLIFYIPLVFGLVMLVPVAVGETMGKKKALKDMANYTKGCEADLKEADYCTLITEDGKKIALGFVVDASSEYVAVVENGISRSIPIKDKEFSQYVAKIAKSKESK